MKKFNIVTLSSKHRKLSDSNSPDISGVITGGIGILTNLFPNIFGGNRKLLTDSDWLQLMPGAGYWTTQLRNRLKSTIKYDTDFQTNVQAFTNNFIYENRKQICPKIPDSCWAYNQTGSCTECVQTFYAILNKEKSTGGTSPIGITPGGYGLTSDWSTLIPLAIGGIVLVAAMKTKKKRK